MDEFFLNALNLISEPLYQFELDWWFERYGQKSGQNGTKIIVHVNLLRNMRLGGEVSAHHPEDPFLKFWDFTDFYQFFAFLLGRTLPRSLHCFQVENFRVFIDSIGFFAFLLGTGSCGNRAFLKKKSNLFNTVILSLHVSDINPK